MNNPPQQTRRSSWRVAIIGILFTGALVAVILSSGVAEQDEPTPLEGQRQANAEAQRAFKEAHSNITPIPKGEIDAWFEEQAALILDGQPIGTPRLEVGAPAGDGEILDHSVNSHLRFVDLINAWQAITGDTVLMVDAGNLRDDPEQGVVIVSLWNNFEPAVALDVRAGTHVTAVKSGSLRVVGAKGMHVVLESTSGEEFIFDAEEGRFIAPYLEPLPTTRPTPTPEPTPAPHAPVRLISVDADITGRAVTDVKTVGVIDACRAVSLAQTIDVDVVIKGLPIENDRPIGIIGFEFQLAYDPTKLKIVDTNLEMLLSDPDGSSILDASEDLAGAESTGVVSIAAVDLFALGVSVEGVLARITFEAIGPGVVKIDISKGALISTENRVALFDNVAPAQIAIASACP